MTLLIANSSQKPKKKRENYTKQTHLNSLIIYNIYIEIK